MIEKLLYILLVKLSFYKLHGASTQSCPEEFTDIGNGNCYFFSELSIYGLSSVEARVYCKELADPLIGDLAQFEDEREYMDVTEYMNSEGCDSVAYIGAYRPEGELGRFIWDDCSLLDLEAVMWMDDDPTEYEDRNSVILSPSNEMILEYQGGVYRRWRLSTVTGEDGLHFICKIYPEPQPC